MSHNISALAVGTVQDLGNHHDSLSHGWCYVAQAPLKDSRSTALKHLPQLYALGQRVTSGGGASLEGAAALAVFLASEASGALSGRLISAVTDDVPNLPTQIRRIMASDAFTLRRVDLG
jgi:hypothetical protein